MKLSVNYIAILVSGIASMAIGFIWYMPSVFGNMWMRAVGADPNDKARIKEMQKSMGPMYAIMFVLTLVSAYVMARFINVLGFTHIEQACKLALALWAGFMFPVSTADAIFGNRSKNSIWTIVWMNGLHNLVVQLAVAAIIFYWR